MTVLPMTQYHSTELAGVLQPHFLCSAPGLNSSSREQWDIWTPEERLDLQVWPSSPTSNLRKGMQTLQGASSQELPAGSNMQWGKRPLLTFLLGTHMGVPCFTWPASTTTPITIGSRELKMNWGSIFNLHGNTAICLEDGKKRHFERYTGIVDVTLTVLPFPHLLGIHSRSVTWRKIKQKKTPFPILLILVHTWSSRTTGSSNHVCLAWILIWQAWMLNLD